MILAGITEAQAAGARLAPACRVLGISARTIERWRAEPDVGDRRCGPHRRPSNALSAAEEAQVVTVLTSRATPGSRRSSSSLSSPTKACTSRPSRRCTACSAVMDCARRSRRHAART